MKRWIYPEENYHKILRVMAKGEERESKILKHPSLAMTQPTSYCDSPLCKLAENHFAKITGHRKAAITEQGLKLLKYLDAGYAWDVKENKADLKRGKQKKAELAHVGQYAFTSGPRRCINSSTQKHELLKRIKRAEEKGSVWTGGHGGINNALQQLQQNALVEQSRPSVWTLTDRGRVALDILDHRFNVNTVRGIDTRIPKGDLERELHYIKAWFEQGNLGQTNTGWSIREPDLKSMDDALEVWQNAVAWLRQNKQYADNDSVIRLYDEIKELRQKYSNGSPEFVNTLKEWIRSEKYLIGKGIVDWKSISDLATQAFSTDSAEYEVIKKYFMQVKLSN